MRLAHRVSWFLHTGSDAQQNVLHRCDNRLCVRPSHLYEGTQRENMRDMVVRGRQSETRFLSRNAGEKNAQAKLTPTEVAEIRRLHRPCCGADRGNRAELALQFGVTPATITRALNGAHWRKR